MSSSSHTEKEISKMIKDAVRTAIQLQKEAHDEAMQKLVDEHRAINSPLSGTNLQKTSAISYNSMGGIYTTPLATMARPSLATSSGTSTTSLVGASKLQVLTSTFRRYP